MSKVVQNKKTVPEIRFSGFTDDWEQRKLKDTLLLLKDGTHGTYKDVDEGPLLLSAKNIKNGKVVVSKDERLISDSDFSSIHKKFKLAKNDVLLTIVGSIGETAVLQNPQGLTFQRSVAYLRPDNNLNSQFLYQTIRSDDFQNALKRNQVTSAQPGIYLGDLGKIEVKLPNKSEQILISNLLQNTDNLITLHQRKLNEVESLKKLLLQKMFV